MIGYLVVLAAEIIPWVSFSGNNEQSKCESYPVCRYIIYIKDSILVKVVCSAMWKLVLFVMKTAGGFQFLEWGFFLNRLPSNLTSWLIIPMDIDPIHPAMNVSHVSRNLFSKRPGRSRNVLSVKFHGMEKETKNRCARPCLTVGVSRLFKETLRSWNWK